MKLLLAAPVLALALAAPAGAQSLEAARRSYLNADFRVAVEQFEAVLSTPTVDRAAAVEAHRHLAALRLLLGDEGAARRHAEAAVAFDPAVSTPEGAPPALEELLSEARSRFGGRAADVTIELLDDRGEARVQAAVEPFTAGLAEEIGLRCVRGGATAEESGPLPEVRVSVPADPSSNAVHCRAWLAGRGGAHLIESSAQLSVTAVAGESPASAGAASGSVLSPDDGSARDEDDDGGGPWLAVGIGAGALAALAIVVGIVLVSGEDGARLGAPRADGW